MHNKRVESLEARQEGASLGIASDDFGQVIIQDQATGDREAKNKSFTDYIISLEPVRDWGRILSRLKYSPFYYSTSRTIYSYQHGAADS